jgi:DNA invertase Pin-like site-specific DNA recombinase
MQVALYARVSTSQQEKTDTIESQLEALHTYVAAHNQRPLHHRMMTYKDLAFFSPPKICQRGAAYPQCHS